MELSLSYLTKLRYNVAAEQGILPVPLTLQASFLTAEPHFLCYHEAPIPVMYASVSLS